MKQVSVPDSESGAGGFRVRCRAERVKSSSHHYRITQRPKLNYSQLPDDYTQHTRRSASAPYWKWLQLHILSLTSSVGQCYFMFERVSMSVVLAWLRPHYYYYYYGWYKKARPHGVVIHIFSFFVGVHRIFPHTSFERASWKTNKKCPQMPMFSLFCQTWNCVGLLFRAHAMITTSITYCRWSFSSTQQ